METRSNPTPARPADLKRLGRYTIVRPLSKGGMALVYEARRDSLAGVSPRVAIKLILPEHQSSETFRDLFINEARLGASMHHQNLVQIQDFDSEGEQYFLVMEYVEGVTLRRIISICHRHDIQIPLGVIAEIGRQACDGLHYAHCARDEKKRHLGLVHRDIKPSNVILNPHGVVKVLDFGISKGRLRQERQGSVKGTWGYMAPEQATGRGVAPASDVFGLATVLYEMAARGSMFVDKSKDEIKRLLKDDHAARMAATLHPSYAALIGVLVRGLQRDPRARYNTAEEFGRALSSLLPDPITARDEVTRFFDQISNVEKVPGTSPRDTPLASAGSTGSIIVPSMASPPTSAGRGWIVTAVAASLLTLALFAVVVLLMLVIIGQTQLRETVVEGTAAPSLSELAEDEPAGPAGEGAPGEEHPPPVRTGERAPPKASASPKPKPKVVPKKPEGPVRVRVVRTVPGESGTASEEVVAGEGAPVAAPVPQPAAMGTLYVGARQAAEVYIGGQYVAPAPVRRDLPTGRYAVSIVATDGRRRTFEIDLTSGVEISRTWDFDRMEWR